MIAAKIDRFGNKRLPGYNARDFRLCPRRCFDKTGQPAANCPRCGGYGEVPRGRGKTAFVLNPSKRAFWEVDNVRGRAVFAILLIAVQTALIFAFRWASW